MSREDIVTIGAINISSFALLLDLTLINVTSSDLVYCFEMYCVLFLKVYISNIQLIIRY